MTTTIQEAQAQIREKMAKMKEELKALGERLFQEGSQEIFTKYPEVKSFSWTQYTPYFNDGDECIFGVNDYFTVELHDGTILEDVYDSSYWREKKIKEGQELELEDLLAVELSALLRGVDDDTMKSLFGDHVRVKITKEGIETEEYEHE